MLSSGKPGLARSNFGRSEAKFGPRCRLAPNSFEVGPNWAQVWPIPGQGRQTSAESARRLAAELRAFPAHFGPGSTDAGPNLADVSRMRPRTWSQSGHFGRGCPLQVDVGQTLGQRSAKLGPRLAPNSVNIGKARAHRPLADWDEARHCPVGCLPNSAPPRDKACCGRVPLSSAAEGESTALCSAWLQCRRAFHGGRWTSTPCRPLGVLGPRTVRALVRGAYDIPLRSAPTWVRERASMVPVLRKAAAAARNP